jgi:hypothetical protein
MRILIIGAGWYGSHIAKKCIEKGHTIVIVDKENDFFRGSSYKNQNRLHLGFHYPRSDDTIHECLIGYSKFKKEYPMLSTPFSDNFYFISTEKSKTSLTDFQTVFSKKNIQYNVRISDQLHIPITQIEPLCIQVNEEYIHFQKARTYFQNLLGKYLYPIQDPSIFSSINTITSHLHQEFDYILNCTYNQLDPIPCEKYELYLTLLYKIENYDTFGYTIMDGPFFSIYPYDIEKKLYTVTSVKDGVLYEGPIPDTDRKIDSLLEETMLKIENTISSYIPSWKQISNYHGYFTSWKAKPATNTDDRSVRFSFQENVLHMYGGKITGIFHAEEILCNLKIL